MDMINKSILVSLLSSLHESSPPANSLTGLEVSAKLMYIVSAQKLGNSYLVLIAGVACSELWGGGGSWDYPGNHQQINISMLHPTR